MELVFASANQNKVNEISKLWPSHIKLLSLNDIHCYEDILETQTTIEGNALQKAKYIFNNYGKSCFADDTGMEVETLNGRPGVYSARYAGEQKNANDNMNKVLNELEGADNRKACFKTVIALITDSGEEHLFEGIINGKIIHSKRGKNGFGYDPIFEPEGYDKTFGEMDMGTKNKISHRALAVQQLLNYITGYL